MLSQALRDAVSIETLKGKRISDIAGMMPEPIFIKNAPGYGDLTLSQYKALPEKAKEYYSYVLSTRALGEKPMDMKSFLTLGNKDKIPSTAMGAAIKRYVDETGKLPSDNMLAKWTKLYKTPPVQVNIGEKAKVAAATTTAKLNAKAKASVASPELISKIEKRYPPEDVYFDHRDQVEKLVKDYGISEDKAITVVQHALVRQELDTRIRQAYRDQEVTYVKGGGWYVGNKMIRRDPYATK